MSFTLETLPEMRKMPSSPSADVSRMATQVSITSDIVRPDDRRCSSRAMPKTGFCDELAEEGEGEEEIEDKKEENKQCQQKETPSDETQMLVLFFPLHSSQQHTLTYNALEDGNAVVDSGKRLLVVGRLQLDVVNKHLSDAHLLAQKVQHLSLVGVLWW